MLLWLYLATSWIEKWVGVMGAALFNISEKSALILTKWGLLLALTLCYWLFFVEFIISMPLGQIRKVWFQKVNHPAFILCVLEPKQDLSRKC